MMTNQMLYATLQLELREARAELAAAIARAEAAEAERDALREQVARQARAATEFANTMAALTPVWTSKMAKAWIELFAIVQYA